MTLYWINPLALLALAAAAVPVLAHLLRRHRAVRVPFPTLRFLEDSRAAAVRLRSLSDRGLLALRIAILAAAVVAAAQPELLTARQWAGYDARISRAIVVDTSPATADVERQRNEAVASAGQGSAGLIEIRTADVGRSLCAAAARLLDGPVARREIVVISGFLHGTVTDADVGCVPPDVGLRFIPITAAPGNARMVTLEGVAAGGMALDQQVAFEGTRTRVILSPRTGADTIAPAIVASPDEALPVTRLLRAVARSGAPAATPGRPLSFIFPPAPLAAVEPPRAAWMIDALVAARADATLRAVASSIHGRATSGPASPWVPVARSADGAVVVAVAARNAGLIALVSATPSDLLAVVAVRALLTASAATPDWRSLESERVPPSQLKAWTRAPSPIRRHRFRPVAPGDGRWFWALAVVLLGIESAIRRERAMAARDEVRAA